MSSTGRWLPESSSAPGSALRGIWPNAQVFGLPLDAVEKAEVEGVLAKSRELMQLTGDCGDENR